MFVGGVKRLPTLTAAATCCPLMALELPFVNEWYFASSFGGGGNSKLGRLEVADRRAVKLDPVPDGSRLDVIPDGWTPPVSTWYWPSRPGPGGLYTSVSAVGGVGNVFDGGMEPAVVDAAAPGQYWPACATWLLEKSREGNLYLKAEDGVVGSNGLGEVVRAGEWRGHGK